MAEHRFAVSALRYNTCRVFRRQRQALLLRAALRFGIDSEDRAVAAEHRFAVSALRYNTYRVEARRVFRRQRQALLLRVALRFGIDSEDHAEAAEYRFAVSALRLVGITLNAALAQALPATLAALVKLC